MPKNSKVIKINLLMKLVQIVQGGVYEIKTRQRLNADKTSDFVKEIFGEEFVREFTSSVDKVGNV